MTEMTALSLIMLKYWGAKCDLFSETRQNDSSESLPSILKLLFLISFLKILTYQKENKVSDNEIMKSIYRIIF